jgi:cysteine desulfuration protein SufE
VWLVTLPQADGTLVFKGDSDAHIVSGLVAIMLRLYSGRAPADIVAFDAKAALDKLGLSEALSSQRSNGLKSMVARIQRDAQAALGQTSLG